VRGGRSSGAASVRLVRPRSRTGRGRCSARSRWRRSCDVVSFGGLHQPHFIPEV
jgi:hypothetical protein